MSAPTVVKLGGSLATHPQLSEALELVTAIPLAVVVVGGGGAADWIRTYAKTAYISGQQTHRLALLATELYAQMLASLNPKLRPTSKPQKPKNAGNGTQIWLATEMAMASPLPKTWAVTSDSLALWLCEAVGAERLLLLKARSFPERRISKLRQLGAVDGHFSRLWARRPAIRVYMLAPDDWRLLPRLSTERRLNELELENS